MSRGFIFFMIVALLAGVALWGYIGSDGHQAVKSFLTLNTSAVSRVRIAEVELGGVTVRADVAETNASREAGLSGRTRLNPLEGMLFLFDYPGTYGFWMKDMLFPIDIIWENDGKVVDIVANAQPSTNLVLPVYKSKTSANRVLEVQAGFAKLHHVDIGSAVTVRFDGTH